MSKFIAAMDHSGGSTGGVLERYGQTYTEDTKMELVNDMRLRMVNSPDFNSDNIWAAILYKDTVDRGMVTVLKEKGIEGYLKIDSGCEEDGTLKDFNIHQMLQYALANKCTGTKMRSIIKSRDVIEAILEQQFRLAETIYVSNLMPIVEPEVPIEHTSKGDIEEELLVGLTKHLNAFHGKCILKLTLPEVPNLYKDLITHPKVHKVVGLSGGYTTNEACRRLRENNNMSASFSRALSEGLVTHQDNETFNARISANIKLIKEAAI